MKQGPHGTICPCFEVRPKCLYLNTHAQRFHLVFDNAKDGSVSLTAFLWKQIENQWGLQRKSRHSTMSLSIASGRVIIIFILIALLLVFLLFIDLFDVASMF